MTLSSGCKSPFRLICHEILHCQRLLDAFATHRPPQLHGSIVNESSHCPKTLAATAHPRLLSISGKACNTFTRSFMSLDIETFPSDALRSLALA